MLGEPSPKKRGEKGLGDLGATRTQGKNTQRTKMGAVGFGLEVPHPHFQRARKNSSCLVNPPIEWIGIRTSRTLRSLGSLKGSRNSLPAIGQTNPHTFWFTTKLTFGLPLLVYHTLGLPLKCVFASLLLSGHQSVLAVPASTGCARRTSEPHAPIASSTFPLLKWPNPKK